MDWQQATALTIVAATAAIFAWSRFRPRGVFDRKTGSCGCDGKRTDSHPPTITFRAKRGERSQIIVKNHP